MAEFTPAKSPPVNRHIATDVPEIIIPKSVEVSVEPLDAPTLYLDLSLPAGSRLAFSLEGASVVAKEIQDAIARYLDPHRDSRSEEQLNRLLNEIVKRSAGKG